MRVPKVSVLIPVFNGEPFLVECLESILAQDFTDFEILLADDHSKDGSLELLKRYADKDPRLRFWKNPKNLGLTGNFNRCLSEARGEYIKYVLQDDKLLSPSALRQMVEALDKHPGVSLIASASYLIDRQSRKIERRDYFQPPGIWDGKRVVVYCLEKDANIIGEPSLVMFRKRQAARGYDQRYAQTVDLEMWFHLLEQGDLFYIAEPLCAFRQHPAQQTTVNRRDGVGDREHLTLLETYYPKRWLQNAITRQGLFSQVRFLRKRFGGRGGPLAEKMMTQLGRGWYPVYWTRRKIVNPLKKMKRQLRKKLRPAV